MKNFLSLIFLLGNVFLQAQSTPKSKNWLLAFNTGIGGTIYKTNEAYTSAGIYEQNGIFSDILTINFPFELVVHRQIKKRLSLGFGVGYFANRLYNSAWNGRCGGTDTRAERGYIHFRWQYFTAAVHGSWLFGKNEKWRLSGALRNYFLPITQNISEAKCFTCEANKPFMDNLSKAAPSRFHTFELALGYKIPLSKNGRLYLLPKAGYEQLLLKSESDATPQGRFFTDISILYDLQKKK